MMPSPSAVETAKPRMARVKTVRRMKPSVLDYLYVARLAPGERAGEDLTQLGRRPSSLDVKFERGFPELLRGGPDPVELGGGLQDDALDPEDLLAVLVGEQPAGVAVVLVLNGEDPRRDGEALLSAHMGGDVVEGHVRALGDVVEDLGAPAFRREEALDPRTRLFLDQAAAGPHLAFDDFPPRIDRDGRQALRPRGGDELHVDRAQPLRLVVAAVERRVAFVPIHHGRAVQVALKRARVPQGVEARRPGHLRIPAVAPQDEAHRLQLAADVLPGLRLPFRNGR